ncbi:MAG: S8 family serine peptidase [Verrucomicrobia bacterium]|jgi:subtilisin family serine protease|nr:S8 family serine peptidase [Verrucomicrobiota bacterium]
MKRFTRMALLLGIAPFFVAASETQYVTIGGHAAHPTRILAKRKAGQVEQAAADLLDGQKLQVVRQFKLVPGLQVLEPIAPPISAAGDETADEGFLRQALLDRIAALRASDQFEYVEPDYTVYAQLQPTDEKFQDGTLWGLKNSGGKGGVLGADIDAERAWDITTGSTNVIVAVIDSGIRYTHQDLAAQMWVNPGEIPGNGIDDDENGYVDDVYGINAAQGTGDPMDDNDHGTHCAGTIGAMANGGGPHVGVAWNVRLMALKFLGADGTGSTSAAIECLDYAVAMGAKISNNSWGGGPKSEALYDALVRAREADHLFIAAAGNSGTDNDILPQYPSNYELDNVIAVAALDRRDRLARFSCYGLTSVDLGAPGVEIYSSTSGSDSEYKVFQGTSMATPHVSGVAALALAKYPQATYDELRDLLLMTTVPVAALQDKTTTGGRVNAYNVLSAAPSGKLDLSVTPPPGAAILTPSEQEFFVRVTDLFRITDATVTATVSTNGEFYTDLEFQNDGTDPDETAGDGIYSARLDIPRTATNLVLTITATAPDKIPGTAVVNYDCVTVPQNDNFDSPGKIPAGGAALITTTRFATMEPGEPKHAGVSSVDHSLWWTWSPSTAGRAILDPAGSQFDTVLAVYTGTNLLTLTPVASVDDVGRLKQGYLFFDAQAGKTYRIVAAGKNAQEMGTLRLRAQMGGLPDTNAPSVSIVSPIEGTMLTTNFLMLSGIAFDPQPNASGISQVDVRLNDDLLAVTAQGTTNWTVPLLLRPGFNTVAVWARDYAGNRSTAKTRSLIYAPQLPANDHFNLATPLVDDNGTITINTYPATKEYGEPNHADNDGGHSVWWRFTPTESGLLELTTAGSEFDTLLGIYTGNRVDALTKVAASDDLDWENFHSEIQQALVAGQTYSIALDGYAGAAGEAILSYQFTPMPVYKLTVNPPVGGTVSPGSGYYVSNAVVTLLATPDLLQDFVGWSGAIASLDNPLVFNITSPVTLTANFAPKVFADDFEKGEFDTERLDWDLEGDAGNVPWTVQSDIVSQGQFAARSGAIGHGQASTLALTVRSTGGTGAFDLRVSSEANWDYLEFYIGDELVERWSGEVDWQSYQFELPAGLQTLAWRYVKDVSGVGGWDAAFIDNLELPLVPTTFLITNVRRGAFDVQTTGQSNLEFYIQASPDLLHWSNVATNRTADHPIPFTDPEAVTNGMRFYRAFRP